MARSERQCLPEIATSASGLLAMTSRGASTVLTAASTDRGCLPEIATSASGLLAMTNRRCVPFLRWLVPNGSAFPRLPRRFAPRNDKSGGQHRFNGGRYGLGVPSRDCHVGLRPPRNDKSGGQHCFNGGRYGSGVPSRDCHVASLLAMTNRRCVPSLRWLVLNGSTYLRLPRRFAPRNDKSEVRAVLRWLVPNGSTFPRLPRRFAPRNDKSGSRYDQLNLPRILRFPPYWRSPQRR